MTGNPGLPRGACSLAWRVFSNARLLFLRTSLALVLCGLLTQGGLSTRSGSGRGASLRELGYSELPLSKLRGDARYSGVFGVNGRPVRLLIDSGANSTDINEPHATKVGLKPDSSVAVVSRGALGRPVKSRLGRGTFQIGPVWAEQFPFTISPASERRTATSRYAGQIGLDAMMASGSLIDIPRGTIWVPPQERLSMEGRGARRLGPRQDLGLKAVGLRPAGRFPHLIVESRVMGQRMTWIVDTGAEVSVLAQRSFDRLGLPSQATNAKMIDAAGDRIRVRAAQLPSVDFPGMQIRPFELIVAPLKNVQQVFKDGKGRPVDGIIGMDFLEQSQSLLDPGSQLLYLGLPQ